jgi:spoIIIJ-associated protein
MNRRRLDMSTETHDMRDEASGEDPVVDEGQQPSLESSETGSSDPRTAARPAAPDSDEPGSDPLASDRDEPVTAPATKRSRRDALEAEGDVAADFLEVLLDICDIVGDIDVDIDGDRAAVSIVDSEEGRVPRRLVGQEGKVLEALQELTRLAVQTETGERSRLMLDVAGHRAARRAEVIEVAKRVISDVQGSGAPAELDPMTAFERKIVHDEVLAAGLRSESEGVEPRRYVVVLPAS